MWLCKQDANEEGEIKKGRSGDDSDDDSDDDEGEEGLKKGKLSIKRKGKGIGAGGKSKVVQGRFFSLFCNCCFVDFLNWYEAATTLLVGYLLSS